MTSHIKTLSEILAEMGHTHSAKMSAQPTQDDKQPAKSPKPTKQKPVLNTLPSPTCQNDVGRFAVNLACQDVGRQADLLAVLQNVSLEPLSDNDKATNYLRWLAFYYLSRKELSQAQLRQKLLNKGCDEKAVADLLLEFADKGYQSDERFVQMVIRESIRKQRGKQHIRQALYQAGVEWSDVALETMIDEMGAALFDNTPLAGDDDKQVVDWLKLAVATRTKKYGNSVPTSPKEKARQLRFLQYRGFEFDVCLQALKMTLGDFDE